MNAQTARAVREDFLNWSGGFPPESGQHIWVYVEAARPIDTDAWEVSTLLHEWLAEEEGSHQL
jgi:hypothetical protein